MFSEYLFKQRLKATIMFAVNWITLAVSFNAEILCFVQAERLFRDRTNRWWGGPHFVKIKT